MAGNYVIRVRAVDSNGYVAEKIISLVVIEKVVERSEGGKTVSNGYQENNEKKTNEEN